MLKASEQDVQVYSLGICYCSVCAPADMDVEDVIKKANAQCPTGIESQWQLASDETFANGDPNPRQCDQDSGCKHYLLVC